MLWSMTFGTLYVASFFIVTMCRRRPCNWAANDRRVRWGNQFLKCYSPKARPTPCQRRPTSHQSKLHSVDLWLVSRRPCEWEHSRSYWIYVDGILPNFCLNSDFEKVSLKIYFDLSSQRSDNSHNYPGYVVHFKKSKLLGQFHK